MKKFLLIASHDCYPGQGTNDWIGCFATREEAESVVIKEPWDYNGKTLYSLKINGVGYLWYEIADLDEWMNK